MGQRVQLLTAAACVACAVGLPGAPAPLAAQDPPRGVQVLDGGRECGPCRLVGRTLVRLGDRAGEGVLGENGMVIRGRTGEFLLVSSAGSEEVLVFDAEGDLRTTFGGQGDGPGEFRLLGRIVPSAEGNYVHDLSLGRVTLFDHTHERVSEFSPPWGRPSSWILVGDSAIVAASSMVPDPGLPGS